MVIGIRENSDVTGQGYIPLPQPEVINEDQRRCCLKLVELQEKLKMEATRTTRSFSRLKEHVESSVQYMRSRLTEMNKPGSSSTVAIASLVGGTAIVGFGLLSSPAKQNPLPSADSLFRNADVLKGLWVAAGAGLMIAGVVSCFSASNWRKYKLQKSLDEINNRRRKYFQSLYEAYNVAEDLKQKSSDPRYSEIFFEMFPGDSELYSIVNEMFHMTKQTSDFIRANSPYSTSNGTAPGVSVHSIEMIYELITRVQRDMARVEETKIALRHLHSYQ